LARPGRPPAVAPANCGAAGATTEVPSELAIWSIPLDGPRAVARIGSTAAFGACHGDRARAATFEARHIGRCLQVDNLPVDDLSEVGPQQTLRCPAATRPDRRQRLSKLRHCAAALTGRRAARITPGSSQPNQPMPLHVIPFPAVDPVLISFGPLVIRWYALAYIVGILLGWLYVRALIRADRYWGGPAPLAVADYDDFILWATLGIILGGRAGYVLFYNPAYFAAHPLEILQLWHGGMSFHGGFLGCVLAGVLFARRRGLSILSLGDLTCAAATIGLLLGRLANFINGELWGRPTDVPWAMVFPNGGPQPRHPSQLYEAALEGLVLFGVLYLLIRLGALRRPGLVTGAFALGYGLARAFCELFREPDAQLGYLWGGLTMGMLLSTPLMLAGLAFIAAAMRHRPAGRT
jgi:phosphatidylglycerol:prolipoprotein diacylglycerol transferase